MSEGAVFISIMAQLGSVMPRNNGLAEKRLFSWILYSSLMTI